MSCDCPLWLRYRGLLAQIAAIGVEAVIPARKNRIQSRHYERHLYKEHHTYK